MKQQHPHLHFSVHRTSVNAAWTPGKHPHLSFLLMDLSLTSEPGSRMLSPLALFLEVLS